MNETDLVSKMFDAGWTPENGWPAEVVDQITRGWDTSGDGWLDNAVARAGGTRKMTRDTQGRFTLGNRGGPGRPRRQTERAYMRVLADMLDLARWRKIVEKQLELAEAGDPRAFAVVCKYALGNDPPSLTELAAADMAEVSDDMVIGARLELNLAQADDLSHLGEYHSDPVSHVLRVRDAQEREAAREAQRAEAEAERERKRQARRERIAQGTAERAAQLAEGKA